MTRAALSRRFFLAGCLAVLGAPPVRADKAGWIEVTGSAPVGGDADLASARRKAVADAILAAALAGGSEVRGHSVLKDTRLTSDILVVRPVGRVLEHRIVGESRNGPVLQVRLLARVGVAQPGECPDRRRLMLTAWAPAIRVSANAPAWAETLGRTLAADLIGTAERHPAVGELVRATNRSGRKAAGDGFDYVALTRGANRVAAGGHELALDLSIGARDGGLALELRMALRSPTGETITDDHRATVRLPGPSLLGRAAVLLEDDRQRLADRLARGAAPALGTMLERAGCQGAFARLAIAKGRIEVPVGRDHGLTRTSLAFTTDRDHTVTMLEVAALSARHAVLRPLDPGQGLGGLAGRPVRFVDAAGGLP